MKAVTVAPGTAGSVRLEDVPEPEAAIGRRTFWDPHPVLVIGAGAADDIKVIIEFARL